MNQKEKMINGFLYSPENDEELYNDRLKVKDLCFQYNNLAPSETEKRKELIKQIIGKTSDKYWIEQPFICDYGYNIEIGNNFYANHNLIILDCAPVKFGNNVFIAPNCSFYTACHPIDKEKRNDGLEYALPITVGNNVWIGGGVTVLAGVKIGDNSIIGAGSVVTRDIPSGVIAVGNPCKVLKEVTKDIKDKYRV
ncbi:sugar O-acetyltransferase [bacterium]|nr:sugar O-acetyltransferase [bacterium]